MGHTALGHAYWYQYRWSDAEAQFRIALEGWWAGIRGETGAPGFMLRDPANDAKARQKTAG